MLSFFCTQQEGQCLPSAVLVPDSYLSRGSVSVSRFLLLQQNRPIAHVYLRFSAGVNPCNIFVHTFCTFLVACRRECVLTFMCVCVSARACVLACMRLCVCLSVSVCLCLCVFVQINARPSNFRRSFLSRTNISDFFKAGQNVNPTLSLRPVLLPSSSPPRRLLADGDPTDPLEHIYALVREAQGTAASLTTVTEQACGAQPPGRAHEISCGPPATSPEPRWGLMGFTRERECRAPSQSHPAFVG